MSQSIQRKRRRLADFRTRLRDGSPLIGCFAALPSPGFVEALGHSGLDFMIIDTEHGPAGAETAETLLRATDAADAVAFVRVPASRPDLVSTMLDLGACGIMIPMVETVADLDLAHGATRFAPSGRRGVAPNVRAGAYGFLPMADFMTWGNEETLLIAQIETALGVQNIEELVAHRGVDCVFIGTNDLSTSLGFPGDTTHPTVSAAVDTIVAAAKARSVPLGSVAVSSDMAADWVGKGVNLVTLSSMLGFRAYQDRAAETRSKVGA